MDAGKSKRTNRSRQFANAKKGGKNKSFKNQGGKNKSFKNQGRKKGESQPGKNMAYKVGDVARILGGPNTDTTVKSLSSIFDPVNAENGNNNEFIPISPRNNKKLNKKNKTKKQKLNLNKGLSPKGDTVAVESSEAKTLKQKKKKVLGTPGSVETKIVKGKKPKFVKTPESTETKKLNGKKRKFIETSESVEDEVQAKTQKKLKVERPRAESVEDEHNKTIFVGNVPITCTKKKLKEIFKKYGEIDTIRLRSAGVPDIKTSKKVAIIKQEFHPDRHNLNAYVRFKEEESVKNALNVNGLEVDGFHLRVDLCTKEKSHDNRLSVFLGNMPYNIEEDRIYKHFSDCGEIESVRIIRDSKTGVGKGFGYVNFKSVDSVHLALRLNDKVLSGRQVRVKRCVDSGKPVIKKKFPAPAGVKGVAGQHLKRPFQGSTSADFKNKKPNPKLKRNDTRGNLAGKQNKGGKFAGKQNKGAKFAGKQNKGGKFAGKKPKGNSKTKFT